QQSRLLNGAGSRASLSAFHTFIRIALPGTSWAKALVFHVLAVSSNLYVP
ncbi:hypothetical protein STEG23_024075, partial [Scotinomys teguina]